jgi:hypothetical protein
MIINNNIGGMHMESKALRELVSKIFSDETTKAQFIANPEKVLSKYSINDDEKRAVLNTHSRLGLMTSGSSQLEATIQPNAWWNAPTP